MTKVIVDAATRSKLLELTQAMQLTDESGRILGHFTPLANGPGREPQISEQEVQRRLRAGGGRSLAQIMADLEKRA